MTPWRIALGYIAFSVLALALFAMPLWYGWRANIGTFRTYVPEEMQVLTDLFHREGAAAVTEAVRSRSMLSRDEVVLFAGPGKEVLAGTLRAWPPEVPDAPGTYGLMIGVGADSSMRVVASHVALPGDYHLLMGRESVRFESLVERFWYGMVAALAIVLALGGALAWLLARRTSAVRHSEERYARAMQVTKDGIWEWNPATDEIFMSDRARELWAVPDGVAVRTRADLKRLGGFHPEDLQRTEDEIAASRVAGVHGLDIEYRVIGSAGEVRWVRSQGRLFPGAEGRPGVVTGSLTDITERKLADLALAESEARFRSLTELSSDFFWETDAEHRYTAIELGWAYAGVRNNETKLGLARWEIAYASPDEAAWAVHRATIAARERFVDFGFSRIEADEERFYEHSGEPRYDAQGNFLGYRGVGRDVTARKRIEQALRRSEERYSLAVEAAGDGHTDWNLVTGEFYISPRLLGILGYAPGTTFADRADWVRRFPFHPEDRGLWEAAVAAHFAGREAKFRMDLRIVVNGETRWVAFTFIASRDASGKPVRWTGSIADINDAKRAEEALRESQERYALAVAGSDDGIWDWNLVTNRMFVSERAQHIFGLEPGPTEAPARGMARHDRLSPGRSSGAAPHGRGYLSGARSSNEGEWRVQDKDGRYRWIRIRSICLRNPAGEPVRMAGSVSDVDARRRAEEALRLSEERYALALEASEEGHFDVDLETGEIFASARLNEIYGFPRQAKTANRVEYLNQIPFHPDDRHLLADIASSDWEDPARVTRLERYSLRIVPRPGETRWIQTHAMVTRDAQGRARRRVGVIADITERKLAEEARRLSEERYALAMGVAEEGHWDWNVQTDEIYASAQAKRVMGLPDEECRTRGEMTARIRYHPDDWPRISAQWREALAGAGTEHEFEYRILGGEEPRWIRARWKVFRDASGAAVRVIGIVADITERKLAEEARRLSEERYARAVAGADGGIWDWDLVSGMFYRSPRNQQITMGRASDGVDVRHVDEWSQWFQLHPDDVAKRDTAIRLHVEGRTPLYEIEYRVRHQDGAYHWVHARGVCTRDASGRALHFAGSTTSIDARKAAEEALRLSEERYALAMEASEEAHFDWNVQTDEIFASAQLKKLFGLPADAEYRTRSDMSARVRYYPGDRERLDETTGRVLGGLALQNEFEYRILRGEETRWLRRRWKIFRDAAGAAVRVIGVVTDITERRRAVETLRDSEARFRRMTELSADTYWEQDEKFRYTRTGSGTDIAGYVTDVNQGKTRWELCGDAAPLSSSWEEHEAVLAAHQPFRDFEYRRLRPGGTMGYYSASGAPIFDAEGRFQGYQGVARDITERKRVEEALRQSEERYALAVAGSNEGIFDWDLMSDRVYVSYRAQELFGLPRGELWRPRRDWRHIVTFHPDDAPRLHDSIKAHIEGSTPTYDEEFRIVLSGGGVRWFRQRGIALRDASGKAYRVVGSIGDVTEQHKAEDELRSLERRLRLAQRLEAMGTLAGGIAHDFNNILGAILGYGEMALRDARKGSRLARDLDSIIVAGERGRALVDRVLAFSRSAVGERVPVHVEKVVREALDLLSAKLPPDVTLHAKLHAGCAAMLGDATQVHQVLMNLATNAIHAMPVGGTLRVSLSAAHLAEPRTPTLGIMPAGDYLILQVADSGTGITPEILERIFDPFFTTKDVGTGTGLGLSLVHGIVAELSGAIDVASTPGAGSTFTVFLPRSGDALDSSQKEEPELPRGDGQRVLVVDDEEPLVQLATRTLEELGYAPVGFTSSAAALAAFRADPQRFDAVITDERMPGMSGAVLIREVRGIRDRIPVVLMTGFVGGTVASAAREAGAEEVLKKPLSARDLAASLARVLDP